MSAPNDAIPTEVRFGRRLGFLFGLIVAAAMVFQGSNFSIDTGSVGLVARMGKLVRQVEPGFHWKIPFGIDEVEVVAVDRLLRVSNHPDPVSSLVSNELPQELRMFLTAEKSIVEIDFNITYTVADPVAYVGSVADTPELILLTARSQLQAALGHESVAALLTGSTHELASSTKDGIQRELDGYGAGVSLQEVVVERIVVPPGVNDAVEAVASAIRERDRLILDARKTATAMRPESEKRAADIISDANLRAAENLSKSREEVARFQAAYKSYRTDPAGVVERLHQDMLRVALPKAGSVILAPDNNRQNSSVIFFNQR